MAESQAKSTWEGIEGALAFIGWVIIFLIGPAVPQVLDRFRSADDFWVMSEGPVYFKDHAAYTLEVQNNGKVPERKVEIWAPLPPGGDVVMETSPYEFGPARFLLLRQRGDYRILGIGDLQPGERYTVSVTTRWKPDPDSERKYADIPWVMARVVSADRTAHQLGWKFRAFQEQQRVRWYNGALNLLGAALILLMMLLAREAREPS
jgi:hypothetical protein